MPQLHQFIAIAEGKKTEVRRVITDLHRQTSNPTLVSGQARTYQPLDDDGIQLPPESKNVQVRIPAALQEAAEAYERLWDAIATVDVGNQGAKADIELEDGTILAGNVPVTTLLFLDKQLDDLHTFVSGIVELDLEKTWAFDGSNSLFKAEPIETIRDEKVMVPVVLYPATDKHPAQVEKVTKSVPIGKWTTVHLSGAIPASQKRDMLGRIRKVKEAVKIAREKANQREETEGHVASGILAFVFSPVLTKPQA